MADKDNRTLLQKGADAVLPLLGLERKAPAKNLGEAVVGGVQDSLQAHKDVAEGLKERTTRQTPLYNWVDEEDTEAKVEPKTEANPGVRTEAPATASKNLTFDDFLRESGGDPVKAREWLKSHPGYVPGDKTKAWLEANPVPETKAEEPKNENVEGPFEPTNGGNEKKVENALEGSDNANEAGDKVADVIGADKEQKKQIKEATKSIWSAIAGGSMSKESAGYFLMDAIMKQANNRQRRDSNYIENLSRAAHGDTILGYDVSNDEKSKYETQVLDPALERANTAAGIESESNAQTSADLSTTDAKKEYAKTLSPEDKAQIAAINQVTNGTYDALTNAIANGDPDEVKKAMDAALQDKQLDTTIKSLQAQLQQGTLNADIKAAELANSLTQQQIALMQKQGVLLGAEGDLKKSLTNAIKNVSSGQLNAEDILLFMTLGSLGKLGVM